VCGRFSLGASATILAAQFDLFEVPAWSPRYNIAPTQEVLVVVRDPAHPHRQARRHRWGLIPSWAKDPSIGNQLINAQAETAAAKPAFRVAFRKRRCLILADGFYEWKTEGRHKQPFHIRLRDGRPFAFAGLWEHWEGGEAAVDRVQPILRPDPGEEMAASPVSTRVNNPLDDSPACVEPLVK
jgi:putative SOS response-associated peptidase YedK